MLKSTLQKREWLLIPITPYQKSQKKPTVASVAVLNVKTADTGIFFPKAIVDKFAT